MRLYRFRSRRIGVDIDIDLRLQRRENGELLGKRLRATIVNISRTGACIELERVHLDGEHVFFSTMEGGENHLYLGAVPSAEGPVGVTAKAVWMDKKKDGEQRFRIGMKFLVVQKTLFTYTRKNRSYKFS